MNKKIYVLFPLDGEEKIEFDFILHQEADRFIHHFRNVIEPPYTGSDVEIVNRIKEEISTRSIKLRAMVNSGQWMGLVEENGNVQEYHIGFPKVNFEKYLCAIRYAEYLNTQKR